MKKRLRPFISLLLLLLFLLAGGYYVDRHQSLITQLGKIPLTTIAAIFGLYIIFLGILALILSACLRVYHLTLPARENIEVNAHTLLLNFFVPGQSGPIYRGVYLYKKYKLQIKKYLVVTLLYYLIYAVLSIYMLLSLSRPWWQTVLATIVVGLIGFAVTKKYAQRAKLSKASLHLTWSSIVLLIIATAAQVILQTIIYGIELHSANHHIDVSQVITYTGAANLALFVSLTPGGIGIREAFLLFTRQLSHISSANIILASLIDRSVYLVFLVITGLVVIASLSYRNLSLPKRQRLSLKRELTGMDLAKEDTVWKP